MKTCQGTSLVELLAAMTVLAIVIGFAWPSMQNLMIKIEHDQTRNSWQQLIKFSRNAAVDFQTDVTFCPFDQVSQSCVDYASDVWAVFTDANTDRALDEDETLLRFYQPKNGLSFRFYPDNRRYLRFSNKPTGFYSGHMRGLTLCPNGQPDLAAVHLKVNIMGRVAASRSRDAEGVIMRESGSTTYAIEC